MVVLAVSRAPQSFEQGPIPMKMDPVRSDGQYLVPSRERWKNPYS